MGTSAGPSLAGIGRGGASNLVLEMDAHDAKSYPGEPTNNYIKHGTDGIPAGWGGDGSNQSIGAKGVVDITDNNFKYNSYPTVLWTPGDSYNVYLNGTVDIDQTALSTDWTFSCYVKAQDGGTLRTSDNSLFVYFYRGTASYPSDSGTGTITDVGGGWHRVHLSVSGTSNYAGLIGFSSFRAETKFYLSGAQLEKKTYPTPFVTGVLNSGEVYDGRPASVNLMIHGNVGTGQSFSDSSPSKHTITANGDVTHSGGQSKFSGGSFLFDGTGDYLEPQSTTLLDITSNTQSFTVDMWVYPTSIATSGPDAFRFTSLFSKGLVYVSFGFEDDGTIKFYTYDGTAHYCETSAGIMQTNQWQHIAYVSNGGTLALYYNGASKTLSSTTLVKPSQTGGQGVGVKPKIGHADTGYAADGFIGYMDEYRITDGTALWVSAFTPPTRRNLSAPVVDRSGNHNGANLINGTDTDTSTYRVGEVIRPIESAVWDFDGTDEFLTTPFGSGRNVYTNPVSVCAWVKADSTTASRMWLDVGGNGTNQRFYCALITASNPSIFGTQGDAWAYSVNADTSKWYHQALVMDNGTARAYYDGIAAGTRAFTSYTLPSYVRIGGRSGYEWDGKIAAVQIYDTILTAQQVKENFNQQRSRFNV